MITILWNIVPIISLPLINTFLQVTYLGTHKRISLCVCIYIMCVHVCIILSIWWFHNYYFLIIASASTVWWPLFPHLPQILVLPKCRVRNESRRPEPCAICRAGRAGCDRCGPCHLSQYLALPPGKTEWTPLSLQQEKGNKVAVNAPDRSEREKSNKLKRKCKKRA